MTYSTKDLPMLLKRKHFRTIFGISDALYYSLINSHQLPTIKLNNRVYVDRDKFLSMINQGELKSLLCTYEERR